MRKEEKEFVHAEAPFIESTMLDGGDPDKHKKKEISVEEKSSDSVDEIESKSKTKKQKM
jgi:hypothetical protein